MGVFNNFPYANFHELNADWILEQVRKVTDEWEEYKTSMDEWKQGVNDELAEFQAWFDNLDVQDEVRTVINELILSGKFIEITSPQIVSATEAWLAAHITPTTPAVDDTLSISGAAADAKVTGDRISNLKEDFNILAFVGFDNDFDSSGYIVNGTDAPSASFVRTSEYYNCNGWEKVYVKHENGTCSNFTLVFYDASKQFISNQGSSSGSNYNVPAGAVYYRCYKDVNATGRSYVSNEPPKTPTNYDTIVILRDGAFKGVINEQADSYNRFDNNFNSSGYINIGVDAASTSFIRTSNYYDCADWNMMFVRHTPLNAANFTLVFYDASKQFISNQGSSSGGNYILPENAAYYRVYKLATDENISYISKELPSENIQLTYAERDMLIPEYAEVKRSEYLDLKRKLMNTDNRTIVNFGDSIIGNTQDGTSVSGFLSALTGYKCINVGFGGCQMSNHNVNGWSPFSMCNLVDAIVNNNWTAQDASWADRSSLNLPYYFGDAIARLKAIDFNKVYMITIEYGTNDWSSDRTLDDLSNHTSKDTFAGALRYTIETLLEEYPDLLIVVQNPTPRVYMSGGAGVETSDTKTNNIDKTLVEYINTENDVCKEYKIPVIDAYYQSNFNYFTHDKYYASASDDVHLGYDGREKLGEIIASYLLAHFK